jgi:predicted RNA-binding protein
MCEFSVLLKEKTVFKDAIYVKVDGSKVTVKDVLGNSMVFENCKIVEVDVNSERLVLSQIKLP